MTYARFKSPYDHVEPGKMTHYKPDGGPEKDGVYWVSKEVLAAAKGKGKATEVLKPAKDDADEQVSTGLRTDAGVAGADLSRDSGDDRPAVD